MKDYYIVKKSVKKSKIYRPKNIISIEEYRSFIDNHSEFTWLEETDHGKKWDKLKPIKKGISAYLNYNSKDEKSFVSLSPSVGGYTNVQFDYKVTYKNLMDLLSLVQTIDCNLWQIKPKKVLVDEEYTCSYKKKIKPQAKSN